jgi:hypothetical protein
MRSRSPLVGRDEELAELSRSVQDLARGEGGLVLIVGEPGIGKTCLAEASAERAAEQTIVAWGRAWEMGGAPPYWMWIQVLRALRRDCPAVAMPPELDPMLPELVSRGAASASSPESRFVLFDAVLGYLSDVASERPVLVVLDDLHAADEASLQLLSFVVGHLRASAVLIVGTYRPLEARMAASTSALFALISRAAQVVAPRRLGLDDAATLATAKARDTLDSELLAKIHAVSEGNPLFLTEILALVAEQRARGQSATVTIPASVHAAVREHLGRLPTELRALLETASVLGLEFTAAALATVRAEPVGEVLDALAVAVQLGVLAERDTHDFAFAHGILAETLHRDLPAARRASLHLALADGIAHDPAEIARHLFEAGPEHGERAARAAAVAAEDACRRLAFEMAEALARRALEIVSPDAAPLCFELLRVLGEAQILGGKASAGKENCRLAGALGRQLGASALVARAALTYGLSFTFGETDDVLVALIDDALAGLDDSELGLRARLLSRRAGALTPALESARPLRLAREALALSESLDDKTRLDVLYAVGSTLAPFAPPEERRVLNEEALRLAEVHKSPIVSLRSRLRLVFDLLERGDVEGSRAHVLAYETQGSRLGLPFGAWPAAMLRAMFALLEGRFADQDAALAEARRGAGSRDEVPAPCLLAHRLFTLRASGDEEALRRERHAFLEYAARSPQPYREIIAAHVHLRLGGLDAARANLARTSPSKVVAHQNVGMGAWAAELAWRLGDRAWAAPVREWLLDHQGRLSVVAMAGFACDDSVDRALMLVAAALGRREEAHHFYRQAATGLRAMNARPLEARLHLEWAEIVLADPDGQLGAAEPLAEALSIARALGLGFAPRVELLLRGTTHHEPRVPELVSAESLVMSREPSGWLLRGLGTTCRTKETKGMEYLSRLLDEPGREVHVLELTAGGEPVDLGDAGEMLDARARTAYRARLDQLRAELAEAEAWNDSARIERARSEADALETQLVGAVALGGRSRRAARVSERARIAVKRRLDDAVRRIGDVAPALGEHLERALRTGLYCSYLPDRARRRRP